MSFGICIKRVCNRFRSVTGSSPSDTSLGGTTGLAVTSVQVGWRYIGSVHMWGRFSGHFPTSEDRSLVAWCSL